MNFYFDAAKALDKLNARQGSIKGVIGHLPEKDRKRGSALVIETLKYKDALTEIINNSGLLKQEKQKINSMNLALLLVHDLLLSRGIQAGDGPIKQAILRHKTRLHAEFQKLKIKRGVKNTEDLAQAPDPRSALIPRYVRVNTLLWTVADAVSHFKRGGFVQENSPMNTPFAKKSFRIDDHVPDLLAFHPSVRFHDSELLAGGRIILQDKASCFPAVALSPPAEDDACVIDATAAPGNKTTHLSALMQNRGKLFAFERDKKRFGTLRMMIGMAQCKNIEPINADFLTTDPSDERFGRVTHILLDPSCSGSGIVNRLDYLLDDTDVIEEQVNDGEDTRLAKLASFQLMMIRHAMKFASVQKIVYSTCSVHEEENEGVVTQALSSPEALSGKFVLCPREYVLPSWPRRGLKEKLGADDADAVIRCSPDEDQTNGFFVSCFVRESPSAVGKSSKRKRTSNDDPPTEKVTNEKTHPASNESQAKKKHKARKSKQLLG
ncbi:S-adenosyl-L-methionine-dependent methyltransferase [Schizopora paradoxa]|uniref:S-adenosyl-L-methionine-dependent methyltransferase n=1 Tax=Schizopora paradoxa TaxID=27342 RepID=A0A0H2RMF1_9AGAM|nr:S-adenosyl-L-methionine-dependent methyltransferase [Schizopora paradoxa]